MSRVTGIRIISLSEIISLFSVIKIAARQIGNEIGQNHQIKQNSLVCNGTFYCVMICHINMVILQ